MPVIRNVNWGGLKTLYVKEVRRFFKVQLQTIWAPALTTLLFLVIFTRRAGPQRPHGDWRRFPFADFLAPGLIVMGMIQNAFANSSFSLLVGKIQGNIVDYLMPPLSTGELIAGLVGAAVTRAVLVGLAVWLAMLLWPGVHVVPRPSLGDALVRADGQHDARLPRPASPRSGRRSSTMPRRSPISSWRRCRCCRAPSTRSTASSPAFRAVSHANPFFYVISGFRYGFLGVADSPVLFGALLLLGDQPRRSARSATALLRSGWKLKA